MKLRLLSAARLSFPLAAALAALLAASSGSAATLYWDGTTSTANPDGGNGAWDNLTTSNWDNSPFGGADTQWNNSSDSAFFGGVPGSGAAGTVSLAAGGITTGGIVVDSGSVVVTPTSANGFVTGATGGDIINGGNLTYSSANAWGVTGRDVTFNGTGSLTSSVAYTGGTLTVNSGANAQLSNSAALAFATTTGTGTIINTPSANSLTLNLGNASGFTGNIQNRGNAGAGAANVQFSSLGDGGALQFAGGNSDSQQAATFTYSGTGTLTFSTRQVQILDRLSSNWEFRDNTLANNSANGGNNWIINTDLLVTGGRWITAFGGSAEAGRLLILSGSNTADNAFNGVISNGTNPNGIGLSKTGNGKWILSNSNTYTGATSLSVGTLALTNSNAIQNSGLTISGGTLSLLSNTNNTTFADTSTTLSAGATINVDNNGSGTGNTLKLGAVNVSASPTVTLTVTNGNTYILGLGAVTQTLTTGTTFTVANAGSLTMASFTTNSTTGTAKLSFTGAGTATISGNITQSGANALALDRATAAGSLILQGTNNMTGAVTITNGTIQTAVATNAFGSTTGISIGASGTLALRGDSTAAFSNGTTNYPVSLTSSGATINVDQASSATAGTTLTLGTVSMPGAYQLNTTGANGVSLALGAVTGSTANDKVINNTIWVCTLLP